METNSRSKLFPILGIVFFCVMVGMVLYPYLSPTDETSPQTSNIEPSKYSFEKPGQLKQLPPDTNRFKDMTPEQLEQAAADIIQQTDQLVLNNPVPDEPMTPEQQQEIEQRMQALDQQIQQIESGLKP